MIWGESLREALKAYAEVEYEWGARDCIQFVSTYVKNRTGTDYASRFPYDSELSALKLMSQHGGVEGLIESCLGASRPDALPGDVVVIHAETFHIPGVFNGSYVWTFVKDRGLCYWSPSTILCAWSV